MTVEPKPDEVLIRNSRRTAVPTIRGYHAQFVLSALYWMRLADEERLYVEGNEDLDRYFSENGVPVAEEIQTKEYAGPLTERSKEISKALINFLCAFSDHRQAGRRCRLVFRTTAALGNARIPILEPWMNGQVISDEELLRGLSRLVTESGSADATRALESIRDTAAALTDFRQSVTWAFEQPDLEQNRRELMASLGAHELGRQLGPQTASQRVLERVLAVSSLPEPNDRCLTRLDLDVLLSDGMIEKEIREFEEYPNLTGSDVYLGYRITPDSHAVLVALIPDQVEAMQQAWERYIKRPGHLPGSGESAILGEWESLAQSAAADLHMQTGFDLYASFDDGSSRKPCARFRRLIRDVLPHIAARRISGIRIFALPEHLENVTRATKGAQGRDIINVAAVTPALGNFATEYAQFWAWVLSRFLANSMDMDAKRLLDGNLPKIRCVYDRNAREYYAREHPITDRSSRP